MLAQRIEGEEKAIYYVSNKFLEHETHYSPLEKTTLALVWATKKFKYCMLGYTVHVIALMDPIR